MLHYRCDVQEGPLLNLQGQVPIHNPGGADSGNCIAFTSLLNKDEISGRQRLCEKAHPVCVVRLI
jgi:hypothetical protein